MGARNFTEQSILGEIIAQHLTRRLPEIQVDRRLGFSSSALADAALQAGEIDIYPEYSGAAFSGILKLGSENSREAVRDQIREGYRQTRHCEWFGPLGFDNPFALVIREETAARLKVRTLSEAADRPEGWAVGIQEEFQDRSDGLPLLMRKYRLKLGAPPRSLELNELYPALAGGEVSMIAAYATDAGLDPALFAVLQDDQHAFPPYEAGVVVRTSMLQNVAGLAGALKALNGRITAEQMRAMNRRVEFDKVGPERVAADFLKGSGL